MSVDARILAFVGRLRQEGVQVSLSESMDACRAVLVVPLGGKEILRHSLRSTLIKRESDIQLFDAIFDEYFGGLEALAGRGTDGGQHAQDDTLLLSPQDLAESIAEALRGEDNESLLTLARMTAATIGSREGGFGAGSRPISMMAGSGYYVFRALEMLNFSGLVHGLEEMAMRGEIYDGLPPVLALEELRDRVERFKVALDKEVERELALKRGSGSLKRKKMPRRAEEIDFIGASLRQVEDMRRVLPALARKLAARMARRDSRGKWGKVDIRNTLRHSMSSGGVPIEVKYRKRTPSKPELFILCDVSGSVRTFSTFTLQLVYSLHQQFRSVRSFAFIDRVDEVTDCFNRHDVDEAVERVYRDRVAVDGDGHSDVGRALEMFKAGFFRELSHRSTVLILSDARNNNRDPRSHALRYIAEKVRRVYWLNPEPVERWATGDSVIYEYARECFSVDECRNLKQLADFVYRGS